MTAKRRYWFMGMWWTEAQLKPVYNALKREARARGEAVLTFKQWVRTFDQLAQLQKRDPGGDISL